MTPDPEGVARGDLTDEQWRRLEPLLPPLPKMGRPPRDRRQVFDGIWWRARTGSPWRDVPERYGPGETAYTLFRRWQIDGTWATVLQVAADAAGHIEWEVSVDSTVCRARQHEAGARKKGAHGPGRASANGVAPEPDDHALGRSRGGLTTKTHLAVDASFHVLAAVVTAGQRADAPVFTEVMNRIRVPRIGGGHPRTRPGHVLADRADSSRAIREYLRRRQIPHAIPEKRDQAGHRLRRGTAGGRPPSFDREMYNRRHKVESRIGPLKQARGLATRYDKLAVRHEATVQLTLIRQGL
ncbi:MULTISPECIES: IS5 family transposase [unclassified Streptomyces]|uniref:IS5 family transposase n=1 Tax=unclassified Streptomyces TaxID=2593676 RepID=UPI002E813926|nr:IS5 family transposase [Streptomyces sp. NBC_00589]WTI41916.1 IS5 family transposase [Streptomyces sp. NBC_00775]WUB24401.1 IS5 family transposase [Streptomyces sp. NBC_00589]